MFKLATICVVSLLVTGCESAQEMAQRQAAELAVLNAERDATCQRWGATPGTDRYFECRKYLQQRADQAAAADAEADEIAAAGMAAGLRGMAPPPPPPRPMIRCNSVPIGSAVSTNCY
jgi:hypothetical protein